MKTPNEKYRLRILKKKNQSVLNLEQNQRILKNYFKVPEYWPYQRTLISFSKYINFVPNLTQLNFYFKLREFFSSAFKQRHLYIRIIWTYKYQMYYPRVIVI